MMNYNYSNYENMSPVMIIAMAIVIFFVIATIYTILIFFLITLKKNLLSISETNRKMTPGQVWLNLIPFFSIVWMFITVIRIKESNEAEFKEKNINYQGNFGYQLGIAFCVLNAVSIIPYLGSCTSLAALVCWIIYWVEISKLTKLLQGVQQPAQTV